MDDLVPIGEFSQRSGLSPKRLRAYAANGLLTPAAVDPDSGYRYYSPGQVVQARLIDTLRAAGVPLAGIAEVLRDPSQEQLETWSRQLETDAAQREQALNAARRLLAARISTASPHDPSGGISMLHLHTATRSHVGRVRDNNEDAVVANDRLVLVADGMGGHPGGEVAAGIAASLVQAAFTGRSLDELEAAVRAANRAVWDRAGNEAALESMGTTVCAAGLTAGAELAIVHVGDSRAYLAHDGALHQLTEDHSLTADLVRRGELTDTEALQHPQRGILTRVLGGSPDVDIDSSRRPTTVGDRLLLCSDGLFNEVAHDDIARIMSANNPLEATADSLLTLALEGGGTDNVSVAVAEVCN